MARKELGVVGTEIPFRKGGGNQREMRLRERSSNCWRSNRSYTSGLAAENYQVKYDKGHIGDYSAIRKFIIFLVFIRQLVVKSCTRVIT